MDLVSKFSERLKELMIDNDFSIEKLSKSINCNVSSIYEWLSEKVNYMPSVSYLLKIANLFNCSLDFIVGIEEQNYPSKTCVPFPDWFRTAVEAKGFTLYSLGKKTNIGTQQFYKWISGKTEPNLDSLIRIASVLNCTLDYIMGREN